MQNRAIPPRRLSGIRALTVLVGVLLGAGHAVAQTPGAGEGVIEGRVIAAESGKPAGDAFVSVPGLDASAVTAADGSFAMPNPDLMQFPRRGFKQEVYVPHREMVRFMWGEVQPKMAELLGMRESKYGRGAGFSCRNCHVRKDS